MRGARQRILLSALALLAVGVPATVAAFSVGSGRVDNDRARSSQDSNYEGTNDLQCPSGYYVEEISAVGTTWGTYPSVAKVWIGCRSPSGSYASRQFGSYPSSPTFPEIENDECHGSNGALNGLKVNYDRYIKDFTLRCGRIVESGGSVRVENQGYNSGWITDRVQSNDTKVNLVCDPTDSVADTVVTGLRIRYKKDANEHAFTGIQLFCGRVS